MNKEPSLITTVSFVVFFILGIIAGVVYQEEILSLLADFLSIVLRIALSTK